MGDGPEHEPQAISRLVITAEDLRRITEAVQAGLVTKPDPPKGGGVVVRMWIAPLFGFAVLLGSYFGLTHHRPTVSPSVNASAVAPNMVLNHEPSNQHVEWNILGGLVQALTVDGPQQGPLEIELPITQEECPSVAARLGSKCVGRTITVSPSVVVAWTSPQSLQFVPPTERGDQLGVTTPQPLNTVFKTLKLNLSSQAAQMPGQAPAGETVAEPPPASAALTIGAIGGRDQRWCFTYAPAQPATLSIALGSVTRYEKAFTPQSSANVQCGGTQLRVAAGPDGVGVATPEAHPIVTLRDISTLDISTFSRHVDISALTGNLQLEEGRTQVFDTPTTAVFKAKDPIKTTLSIKAGTPSLTLSGNRATSINTDQGNLVRAVWQRNHELALPILLGLVGLMTPLLGAAYKNSVEYLTANPGLLRRMLKEHARRAARALLFPVRRIRERSRRRRPQSPPTEAPS